MKHKYLLKTLLCYLFFTASISFGQIYNADFSNDNDGFSDHTSSSPPADAPANVGPFGTAPNQWSLSYTTKPGTDTSSNSFKVSGGVLISSDWGGQGIFTSQSIDVSGISAVNISAISTNTGANDEKFKYFYILDNGSRVETNNISSVNGDNVNYTINNLDVSGNNTLQVGFEFSENGGGQGYSTSSFTVTEVIGNPAPQITNISNSPNAPTSSDIVTVSADMTDSDGIASATLRWGTTSGSLTNTFTMSNSGGDTYSGIIPAQANGSTIYYTVEATDSNASPKTTTSSESSYLVKDPIPPTIPYEIDLTANEPFFNNWTQYSVSGDQEWNWSDGSGVQMNAYSGSCQTNEDWLISPSFDLTSYQNETLKFEIDEVFDGTVLEVLYSTDYSGTGDPNSATWTSIHSFDSGTTTAVGHLALLNASSVYVGFKYVFETGSCSRWTVKNFEIKERFTWEGDTDNNWNTTSNWRSNTVPTLNSDVVISSSSTHFPTVNSAITDVAEIRFLSGTSGIFETTINADIEYSRNINSADWKLVSAPVSGETIENMLSNNTFGQDPSGTKEAFSFYTNSGATAWDYQASNATGSIANGTGIAIKLNASHISFNGKLNTGPVSVNIATGDRTDFNLIGNPYTAYLSSSDFLNNLSNVPMLSEQTIWLWDGSQYVTRNLANPIEISPTQGFFVKAGITGSITMNTSMLSHQNSDTFMRNSKTSIELIAKSNKNKMSTEIYYIDGTTKGFDNGYDGSMFSTSNKFALFSQLVTDNQGKNYAIQSLPLSEIENITIPIGLNALSGDKVEFSTSSSNLPNNTKVYLEDRLNNEFIDITDKSHTVALKNDANGIGRFYLRVTSKNVNTPIATSIEEVSIYKSSPNTLSIIGLQSEKSSLKVYSLTGQIIVDKTFNSNGYSNINIPSLSTGIYVLELSSELGKISKKIILE